MKKVGSYGSGFLTRIKRSAGDVLAYRWHDDGRKRKKILGPVSKFKFEAAAWKEVEPLKLGRKGSPETVEQLATSLPVLRRKGSSLLDVQDYADLHQARSCTTWDSTERLAHSLPQLYDVAQANGNNSKVVQDLLRYASYGNTMTVYDSEVSDEKRKHTAE